MNPALVKLLAISVAALCATASAFVDDAFAAELLRQLATAAVFGGVVPRYGDAPRLPHPDDAGDG